MCNNNDDDDLMNVIIIRRRTIIRTRTRRIRVIFIQGAHSPSRFSVGPSVWVMKVDRTATVFNIVRNYGEAFSSF